MRKKMDCETMYVYRKYIKKWEKNQGNIFK